MAALNSFTLNTEISSLPENYVQRSTSVRVLGRRGIFIIPYDITRKVAWVRLRTKILSSVNEYTNDWVQPTLGFYGYVWPRRFKFPIGNPVQINADQQSIFSWFSECNFVHLMHYIYLLESGVIPEIVNIEPIAVLMNPDVTDFSFSLSREGLIEVTCEVGYWNPELWGNDPADAPDQDFFDPAQVADTPPPGNQRPEELPPITEPYRPDNNDFGEGLPGEPLPPDDQPEEGRYEYRFSTNWINPQGNIPTSVENIPARTGNLPIISFTRPVAVLGTGIVVTVVDADGSFTFTALVSGDGQPVLDEMVENWESFFTYLP